MDAKQAISMLHNHYGEPNDKRHRLRFYLRKSEANDIADLIESLSAKAALTDIACKVVDSLDCQGKFGDACDEDNIECECVDFCRLRAKGVNDE